MKITTGRLKRAKWDLTLTLADARNNDELIALSDSQMLRFIDELNDMNELDTKARTIQNKINFIRNQPCSVKNRRTLAALYGELDETLFKPDYLCLVVEKVVDYRRAIKGFYINKIKYVRLVGTSGGVKNKTIVFVSERLSVELRRRIDNGRDMTTEFAPAKLEAYRALTCSTTIPVSFPKEIVVVKDCITKFKSDIISINDENDGEPTLELVKDADIELKDSDGYGLMTPSLAEKWSQELSLGYTACGFNTRFAWEKGMVFAFDFHAFAEKIAGANTITDAWGREIDIAGVELVLTTSMVKLWDSYESCEHYLQSSKDHGYTFGISKACVEKLESQRNLNYQFIQSYDLNDRQIDELIRPTVREIKGVLSEDYIKTILFLKGLNVRESDFDKDYDYIKALMIDERMLNDPYIQKKIYHLIRKRINDAKIGVVQVHGNYSAVSGDPYALCQSIFGLPVTGLLKAGEIYNRYWLDAGAKELACFRAPMTCHNNIRLMKVSCNPGADYWYKHLTACTVMNAWDTAAHALNGMDKDGDLVMLTDNRILVENLEERPAILCAQRNAAKKIPGEADLIQSNIDSFGDDIGKTTNWITSMFEVQARFAKVSEEYKVLAYRIMCGQLYQQNAIDKAKGIVAKPMPRYWVDERAARGESEFDLSILASKKPYFMRYIYSDLMRMYRTYVKNSEIKTLREYQISINDFSKQNSEVDLLADFHEKMPVGMGNCVMNRICSIFENEIDGYFSKRKEISPPFDYNILKYGAGYSRSQYYAIKKVHMEYMKRLQAFTIWVAKTKLQGWEAQMKKARLIQEYRRECSIVCTDRLVLCDIVVDICYKHEGAKQFAWDISGKEIIENLLRHNNYEISVPVLDGKGTAVYCGKCYSIQKLQMKGDEAS